VLLSVIARTWTACWDTCIGLFWLLVLVARSGFALNGPYWSWREATAFGNGQPSKAEKRRGVLEYARWVCAMRRAAR
jgi:hypothetical protein